MANPVDHRAATRKRGNPNWGQRARPVLVTEFEIVVRQLRLSAETYAFSRELRNWCKQNRNRVYIPEWLLKEWDIEVDSDLSGAA